MSGLVAVARSATRRVRAQSRIPRFGRAWQEAQRAAPSLAALGHRCGGAALGADLGWLGAGVAAAAVTAPVRVPGVDRAQVAAAGAGLEVVAGTTAAAVGLGVAAAEVTGRTRPHREQATRAGVVLADLTQRRRRPGSRPCARHRLPQPPHVWVAAWRFS